MFLVFFNVYYFANKKRVRNYKSNSFFIMFY